MATSWQQEASKDFSVSLAGGIGNEENNRRPVPRIALATCPEQHMLFRSTTLFIACVFLLPAAVGDEKSSPGLTADEAKELLLDLTPPADEPWRSIPWKIDVLGGQRTASTESKPLFIWAMDGHPLGCT